MMRSIVVLALALACTACGFHLAGTRPLPAPLRAVYLDTLVPYSVTEPPLEQALRSRLRRRGADVTSSPDEANSILRLTGLTERRDVLSIGPDGKALEFQLTTQVTYSLTRGDQILVAPGTLSASRDYSFNAEQILAKEAEETRLQRYLQDELADLVLLRVEAALSQAAATAPPPVPAGDAPPP